MRTINCALTDDQWASLLYSQRIAEYSQGAPRQREEETMSIIAQCFAIGLGFAVGLACLVVVLHLIASPSEQRRHEQMLALHHRTEDRLEEYTQHMGVVAEAAEHWMAEHPLDGKP